MTATTVFTNNRSQAIRLPAELRLPEGVKRLDIRARGGSATCHRGPVVG
jgi:antitoxin VapB